MAATLNVALRNGAAPGTETSFAVSSGFRFQFKSVGNATAGNFDDYPITVSDTADAGNSYEVWFRFRFTGSYNIVENVQFWIATFADPADGVTINWSGTETAYATPTTDDSAVAITAMPTSDPGTANVSIGGSLSGQCTPLATYTDYIVMQLHLGSTTPPGQNVFTFSLQFDEQ